MALLCAFEEGLFQGPFIWGLSLTAMLCFLLLLFVFFCFFSMLALTLLTPFPQIQILQCYGGPGLQLKYILFNLGQLFLVLDSDIIEDMVDKLA